MNHPAEQMLAALRNRFTLSLPRRLDAIEAALGGDVPELERLLHSLAGTSGTYGFSTISGLARRAEEHHTDRETVRRILRQLRAVADSIEPSPVVADESPRESAPSLPNARILCLEDDPDQSAFVGTILRSANYEVRIAKEIAQFESILEEFQPDLLLLDIAVPDGSGIDVAAAVRRAGAHAALPIIFLTGRASLRSRLDGIRAGADDYLLKPVDRDLLLATVAGRLERARSVRMLIERDSLTLAVTRAAFLQSLTAAIDDHARNATAYSLVMLDIDHFKGINDRYGHPIGDRVLSLFGRFLRANVRMEDVVGRCGGEEFGILLAGTAPHDARVLIERLLDRFGRIPHTARDGQRFHVTFSAGVAALDEGEDVETWRQRADDACYGAKRAGRARVEAAA
jgi:diguanylate cyclase (GGDEF)-like protein